MKAITRAAQSILAICLVASLSCIPQPGAPNDPDRDGLFDADELIFGTDPQIFDSDGDGVGDALEINFGTDPNAVASRPVGFPDDWLLQNWLYAASHDASGRWELSALGGSAVTAALMGHPNRGGPFGLASDHHGFLYAARGLDLARIDPFTGGIDHVAVLRDATGAAVVVTEITWAAEDLTLYGVEREVATLFGPGRQIVSIDPGSGLVTRIGVPLPAAVHAIAALPPGSSSHHTPGAVLLASVEFDLERDALLRVEVQDLATPMAPPLRADTPWIPAGMTVAAGYVDPMLSRATGAGSGEIEGPPLVGTYARALGAIAQPPPCPAPCFEPPTFPPIDPASAAIESGDLDGDGDVDLVTFLLAYPESLATLLNDGAGNFAPGPVVPTAPWPIWQDLFQLTDIDDDGALDAVLGSGRFEVFYGDGAGGLEPSVEWPVLNLWGMAIGDVTGDGRVDLVAGSDGNVVVLANLGDRNFAPPVPIATAPNPRELTLLRRNPNGAHDLAILTWDEELVLLDNDGAGQFTETARRAYATGISYNRLAAGELGPAGVDALIVAIGSEGDSLIDVYARSADGGLLDPQSHSDPSGPVSGYSHPIVADITGDGRNDVVVSALYGGELVVFVGNGAGGVRRSLRNPLWVPYGGDYDFAVGDLDGNGFAELIEIGSGNLLYPNRSPYE
jgi:hypothetical protein